MNVKLDHYRGLVGLSHCKRTAPDASSIMLCPVIACDTVADLC